MTQVSFHLYRRKNSEQKKYENLMNWINISENYPGTFSNLSQTCSFKCLPFHPRIILLENQTILLRMETKTRQLTSAWNISLKKKSTKRWITPVNKKPRTRNHEWSQIHYQQEICHRERKQTKVKEKRTSLLTSALSLEGGEMGIRYQRSSTKINHTMKQLPPSRFSL